jgi:ribosomal protein S18 acetylase RimI-like enzyme
LKNNIDLASRDTHDGRPHNSLLAEIRRLTPNDTDELWKLRLTALETEPQAFRETAAEHRQRTMASFAARLGEDGSGNFVYGAFEGALLVGMAGSYRKDEQRAWIWGVFVLPHYRGRGISRALLKRLLDGLRFVPRLSSVHLTVALTQEPARRLYRSCGFRVCPPDAETPAHEEHLVYLLQQ